MDNKKPVLYSNANDEDIKTYLYNHIRETCDDTTNTTIKNFLDDTFEENEAKSVCECCPVCQPACTCDD